MSAAERRSGGDLAMVGVTSALAVLALLLPGIPWPVEWLFGLPFLLVGPGYGLVAALFPARPSGRGDRERRRSPGWPTRLGMTLLSSATLVAVLAAALALLGQLTLVPLVLAVAGVTGGWLVLGAISRALVDPARRANPLDAWDEWIRTLHWEHSGGQRALLVVGVVVLASTVAVVGGAPDPGEPYSEVSLLGPDGERFAGGDVTVVADEENVVVLRLANHEGRTQSYEAVVRLAPATNGSLGSATTLARQSVTLEAGAERATTLELVPPSAAERARLRVLVYEGEAGETPDPAAADHRLRLWVHVAEGVPE